MSENQELDEYVRQARAAGTGDGDIRGKLLQVG